MIAIIIYCPTRVAALALQHALSLCNKQTIMGNDAKLGWYVSFTDKPIN